LKILFSIAVAQDLSAGSQIGNWQSDNLKSSIASPPLLPPGSMLWQTLNQIVERQPQTPTMVIKRYGKDHCRRKKKPEHLFVVDTQHQQPEKA
jgi:hypothetical protein